MSGALRSATLFALALCLASQAPAQTGPPAPPGGEAAIHVRLVHEAGAERVAGAEVILYSLSASGDPGLRRGRADGEGRVTFEGLSNAPEVVYLVGTRLAGVPFGTRFAFAPDELAREVEIAVAEPSPDTSVVTSGEASLRLEAGCSDLRVHHTHALHNPSQRAIHVPPELRAGSTPLLELTLAEGASDVETPLGGNDDGFERSARTLRFWGPLYPGTQEIQFVYGLPLDLASELTVGFTNGSEAVSVLTPVGGLAALGEGLRPEGERPLPAGVHVVQRSAAFAASTVLHLSVSGIAAKAAPSSRLSLAESRLWLELDDAALEVREQHQLAIEGSEALRSSGGTPLFCLPLPEDARDVRFGTASFELGLSRDSSGALAVRGPLPAGESTLSLRYRLPVRSEPFAFERVFRAPVQLLSILVADTGILPHSSRLHARRPVRTEDRAYLHLEAFAIAPGELVELQLERLPRRRATSTLASTGFVFAFALASLFFLAAPLGSSQTREEPAERETAEAIERMAVYEAIEAVDEDYETGKLSESDHRQLRDELRGRAVALLQVERSAAQPRPATPPASCPGCQAAARPGDRFCAQCGGALSSA